MRTRSFVKTSGLGAFALGAQLLLPANAAAQSTAASAVIAHAAVASLGVVAPQRTSQPPVGPVPVPAGITRLVTVDEASPLPERRSDRRNIAWMVVGGAALVVGGMVDGDAGMIISVTGAVIGLVGLYRFMQ
jgi:hypothetical protein